MKRTLVAAVLAIVLAHTNLVYGQGTLANGSVGGRVLDPSGAVVPHASLELTEINKGTKLTAVSNSEGYYSFTEVPYGSYTLKATMQGFAATTVSPINITAREVASVDVSLNPGSVVQTVQVSASALRLESQTSDVGQDLVSNIVTSQPMAHRNVYELVDLVPGVTKSNTEGGSTMSTLSATATWQRSDFTVGGGFDNTSAFLIDGVSATHSPGPGGQVSDVFVGPDSVEEFRVHLYTYPADMPRGSGVVSIITKSGTNAVHGDLYYIHQNSALNASDFFTNRNNREKPHLLRHEFGGAVGGPVYIPKVYDGRNRTFFFFDYDEIRQPLTQTYQMRVPTPAELSGDFSGVYAQDGTPITVYNPFDTYTDPASGKTLRRPFPNNQVPASVINQFSKNLTSYYPKPNVPGGLLTPSGLPTNINNFFINASAPFVIKDENLRIDHQVKDNLRLMFHRIFNPPPNSCPDPYGSLASPTNCNTEEPIHLSASVTWMITPHVVLTSSGYWVNARKFYNNIAQDKNTPFDLSSLGGPYAKGTPLGDLLLSGLYGFHSFPQFSIGSCTSTQGTGYGCLGAGSVTGIEATGGNQNDITWTKGKHTLKFGFQWWNRPVSFAAGTSTAGGFADKVSLGTTGSFTNGPDPLLPDKDTGNALADIELGILGSGSVNLPSLERLYRDTYYAGYVQDDFRVNSKLTLNLGFRYDVALPYREAHNNTAVFDPNQPNPIGNYVGPNTGGGTLNQALGRQLMGGYVFALSPLIGGRQRPASTDWSDLSPRVGFAYSPSSKWVIRGSFAKIYWPAVGGVTDNGLCPSCTGNTNVVPTIDGINPNPAVTLENPFPGGFNTATGRTLGLLTGVGQSLNETGGAFPVSPFSYQFSGGFQHELPWNIRLGVSYVGSRGRHLAPPADCCNDQLPLSLVQQYGAAINDQVTNPFYGIITNPTSILSQPTVQRWRLLMNWPEFTGGSLHLPPIQDQKEFPLYSTPYPFKNNFDGMLVSFEKRFSDGLQLLAAYTWSKTIGNVDQVLWGQGVYQDIYHVENEKAISSSDVPQRLVLSHVYQLPVGKGMRYASNAPTVVNYIIGGWEIGGHLTLASGTPLYFTVTPNNSNTHSAGLYPNILKTPTMTGGDRGQKIQEWFDTTAFGFPAPFTYGNAPRNISSLRTDGVKTYNMSLMKWFPLKGEALKMQLRMDAFNLFNRTQFAAPDTQLGDATFGEVSSVAATPRFIQIGLRLQW
jgi:hypothetical protein